MLKVYDNGGATFDRYTVLRTDWHTSDPLAVECIGMSERPTHPQGFGQHGTAHDGPHLGKPIRWDELPAECQRVASHFRER